MSNVVKKRSPKQVLDESKRPSHALDSRFSLFDVPKLARDCICYLKARGIGRVELCTMAVVGKKMQVHIRYFKALDRLSADVLEKGVDIRLGLYLRYHLPVTDDCEIVWVKLTGIWQQSNSKRGGL